MLKSWVWTEKSWGTADNNDPAVRRWRRVYRWSGSEWTGRSVNILSESSGRVQWGEGSLCLRGLWGKQSPSALRLQEPFKTVPGTWTHDTLRQKHTHHHRPALVLDSHQSLCPKSFILLEFRWKKQHWLWTNAASMNWKPQREERPTNKTTFKSATILSKYS